jgi:hypothetical protein
MVIKFKRGSTWYMTGSSPVVTMRMPWAEGFSARARLGAVRNYSGQP